LRGVQFLAAASISIWASSECPVLAQTPLPTTDLPRIDVEASSGARSDLAPDSVTNFARVSPSSRPHVETFTRDDIEELKPTNVYDLLSHGTGLLPTYQGRKLSFTVNMRGDSNYGFIIDGAYVPMQTAGRLLQVMPVTEIEQVDVVRDSTALMLGPLVNVNSPSGALNSGFIVIRTHSPAKNEAEVRAAVESYGTVASNVYGGSVFTGGLNSPSGYIAGLISQKRSDGPAGYNMWSNSQSAFLKFGLTVGILETNLSVFGDNARYGFERARPDQVTANYADQRWSYAPINSTLITSDSTFHWNGNNSTLFNASYNLVNAQNIQGSYSSNSIGSNQDRVYSLNANLRHSFQYKDTLIQAGSEFLYYYTPTGQLAHAGYVDKEKSISAYVNAEQKLFEGRLTLDASARVDDHTIIKSVDIYNRGSGPTATQAPTEETITTTVTEPVTTTVVNDTTTVVTPISTTTSTVTRPASGPGSGTGTGGGQGGGNPAQFYTYTTTTVTTYNISTTTNGVTTNSVSPAVTTTTTVTAPTSRVNPANPVTTTTTVTTGGTAPVSATTQTTSSTTTNVTTTTTSTTAATYQYFYNRRLPLAKSYSGGAAFRLLPQLLMTGRFSHTEQGGLANVISASGEPLNPESQNKWEIGLVAPIAPWLKTVFNLFDIRIDNNKVPVSYTPINGITTPLWAETDTHRRGFELIGEGVLMNSEDFGQTSYKASWMHMLSVSSSRIAAYPKTIAHDVANGSLTHRWREYSGTVALTYVAPYWSNFNSLDGGYHSVGNFVTVNLQLARTFDLPGTRAKWSVYGRNLTSRKYETTYGFPSWGAVYGSELSFTF